MAALYAILDWPHAGGLDVVAAAAGLLGERPDGPGPRYLQLRCKGADTCTRLELLEQVAPMCRTAGVPLIVNDDLEAALARPGLVAGVHLGQQDLHEFGPQVTWPERLAALRARAGAGFIIGVSTHDVGQVRASAALPVDHIGFGPVQATRSKAQPDPVVGFDGLASACAASLHPVVAIGGLDAAGAVRAASAGAAMVAVIGALVAASPAEIRGRVVGLARALAAT
ncbi:MAG TPA: thiamine phosphate synthase [Nannocystis sp.]|jgi:thiamine-phosphate diphosphorylase